MNSMKLSPHHFVSYMFHFHSSKIKQSLFLFVCLHLTPVHTFGQFTSLQDLGSTANGANPSCSLVSAEEFLYGMTSSGGINNYGTIFKTNLDGTGFTKLFDFDGAINGSHPNGSLISDGTLLFGMASTGGK